MILDITYGLLCCLLVFGALVLRQALRETVGLKESCREYISDIQWEGLTVGVPAPTFSAHVLGSGKLFSTKDLEGHSTVLIFVAAGDSSPSQSPSELRSALRALWGKFNGHVYVVYGGAEPTCSEFVDQNIRGFPSSRVIVDEAGLLFRAFRISDVPQGVELDENTRVLRYGRPQAPDDYRDGEDPWRSFRDGSHRPRRGWPNERTLSGAGFARVDSNASFVITRFRLKSAFSMIPFYLAFRRVRRDSRNVDGLLKAVFLVENAFTCYTLSLWRDEWSIVDFGNISSHVRAANSTFRHTADGNSKRSNVWSAQFKLWAVSCHNLDWEGFDSKGLLGEQWAKRERAAQILASQGGNQNE